MAAKGWGWVHACGPRAGKDADAASGLPLKHPSGSGLRGPTRRTASRHNAECTRGTCRRGAVRSNPLQPKAGLFRVEITLSEESDGSGGGT